MEALAVSYHEVEVGDLAELLEPDDALFEVPDGDVESVAGYGLVVQVVLELEPDRHFGIFGV